MQRLAILLIVGSACGGAEHGAVPPKRPNNELIIGEFERRPPDGTTAARFRADGSVTIAHERGKLDSAPLATGTWKLEKDQLTLTYTGGQMCTASQTGTYRVVVSKIGIRFAKLQDPCDQRTKIDGQTWFRAR